nr:MAG TPA: tail protein [Caudoviricetes sp.]
MAIKAVNQIDVIDLTDGYSVVLTNDNYTFLGTTSAVNGTQTTTTQVMALCGSEQVPCTVGTITCPTGISAVSDGKTPMPTITITATSALTKSGTITIPIVVDGGITINKTFSYSIAFKGQTGQNGTSVTVRSTSVTYQVGASGTTKPTGEWKTEVPSVPNGQFLWTKTVVNYSDGKSTEAYSVSYKGTNGTNGSNGTSVTVSSTSVTYQAGTSGTTPPTGTWSPTVPNVANGQYLWTKTVVNYSDGKSTESYSVSYKGTNGINGTNGKDAITMAITSSGGTIFKNTAIATTLTAHVYKGGVEVTGSALSSLGTIKWYKDGGTTAVATGTTYTIGAGDISNKATFSAQLEG